MHIHIVNQLQTANMSLLYDSKILISKHAYCSNFFCLSLITGQLSKYNTDLKTGVLLIEACLFTDLNEMLLLCVIKLLYCCNANVFKHNLPT